MGVRQPDDVVFRLFIFCNMVNKKITLIGVLIVVLISAGIYYFLAVKLPEATRIGDGKYLGYIHNVDTRDLKIAFDDAVWLSGKAGEDAAIEAGHCTEKTRSECLPNDYFIKNAEVVDENLLIAGDARVFMQTWKMEETGEVATREIGMSDFAELINNQTLHWRQLPYNITIQNGKVTKIEEVYIP